MIKLYIATCRFRDHDITVMSDTPENAARQIKRRWDKLFYDVHIDEAERERHQVVIWETEFDEWGILITKAPSVGRFEI